MAMYKLRISKQRESYLDVCLALVAILMVGQPVADQSSERSRFLSSAVALIFGLDSDYQQDKATPNWGKSAQPGPTYFFSKETNYIHIMNAHACGDTAGPSRLGRNFLYIRSQ
eukprot:7378507-Prymnesium_polylepis.1